MKLDRRELLKRAAASGLLIPAWSLIPNAHAAPYTGKVLIDIFASGGLDQSFWTDPRHNPSINSWANNKTADAIGNLRTAPVANNKAFFESHYQRMLVINGVNTESNAHPDAARCVAVGGLNLGIAHLDELYAKQYGQGLPMGWMSGIVGFNNNPDAFSKSMGLMPATVIPSGDLFRSMLRPNAASNTQDNMKPADLAKVQEARNARLQAMQSNGQAVPRLSTINSQFLTAAEARGMLSNVMSFVPATFDNNFMAAHVGLIAAQAGITSAVQLTVGKFDSHVGHDSRYANELPRLTSLINYIWDKAATLGIANRLFMRIYSEFGRTPYNASGGKDHLGNVGSMVLMEANPSWGNRVLGASGPRHEALYINRLTGAVAAKGSTHAISITPRHIHQSLRNYLGISTSDPRFDLKVPTNETIDLFNPNIKTGYPNT